jgi:hypothetical protein
LRDRATFALIVAVCCAGLALPQIQDAGSSEARKTWFLGQGSADDITRRDGTLDRQPVLDYLRSIENRIAIAAAAKPLDIRVTRASEDYALLLPAGVLFISGGLLERIDNEAALAGLLAHSTVHSQRAAKTTVTAAGVRVHRPLCIFGAPLTSMSWSNELHDEENQVMTLALRISSRAGFDPLPTIELFSKLIYEHPTWAKRSPRTNFWSLEPTWSP